MQLNATAASTSICCCSAYFQRNSSTDQTPIRCSSTHAPSMDNTRKCQPPSSGLPGKPHPTIAPRIPYHAPLNKHELELPLPRILISTSMEPKPLLDSHQRTLAPTISTISLHRIQNISLASRRFHLRTQPKTQSDVQSHFPRMKWNFASNPTDECNNETSSNQKMTRRKAPKSTHNRTLLHLPLRNNPISKLDRINPNEPDH